MTVYCLLREMSPEARAEAFADGLPVWAESAPPVPVETEVDAMFAEPGCACEHPEEPGRHGREMCEIDEAEPEATPAPPTRRSG